MLKPKGTMGGGGVHELDRGHHFRRGADIKPSSCIPQVCEVCLCQLCLRKVEEKKPRALSRFHDSSAGCNLQLANPPGSCRQRF